VARNGYLLTIRGTGAIISGVSLEPLAKAKIPLIHVVGDVDDVVPVAENTSIIEQRYKALKGEITVFHKPTVGHHPHGHDDTKTLVDMILRYTEAVVK
jgi:hypothetical protein